MSVDALLHRLTLAELEDFCRKHLPDALADAPAAARLVAYYTIDPARTRTPDEIAASIAGRLPAAHTPRVLVPLAELPRLAGGKIDLRTLTETPLPAPARAGCTPPADDLGIWVRGVWSGVLDVPAREVVLESGFFETGGTSLDAIRVSARLARVLGHDVHPAWLLRQPRLAAYLDLLRTELAGVPHLAEICAVAADLYTADRAGDE